MTTPQVTPLQRRLFPSITDFLFIGLLLTRIHPTMFFDGDTAWHLWAGERVLAHGPRPIPDPLSFTRAGAPWISLQWLGEAILALAYRYGGYISIAVLCVVVFAATFAWLYRILVVETDHPPAALAVTFLATQTCLTFFVERPAIFSLPLFLAAWQLVRRPAPPRATIVLLPLLTALWANLHPSAFLAPLAAVWAWLAHPGARRRLGPAVLLSALALGATPWGFAWLGDLKPSPGNLTFLGRIEEWMTPSFRDPRFWGLGLFLLLAVAASRGARALTRWEAVWGVGWMAGVLFSARMAPYAVIAWAPFLTRDLADITEAPAGASPGRLRRLWGALREGLAPFERAFRPGLWPGLLAIVALVASPALTPLYPGAAHGFPANRFPERALAAAARLPLGPRVLNGYVWGGYISWRAPGRYRVFIDGRAGFFGDRVLADYLTAMELRPGWRQVLRRYDPDWILVPPHLPLATAAPLTGAWRVAYQDSVAVLLSRTAPR